MAKPSVTEQPVTVSKKYAFLLHCYTFGNSRFIARHSLDWAVQMLLISEALEMSAQRCLEAPLPTAADLDEYGDLLVACLPAGVREEQVQALLSSIHHLGKIVTALHAKKGIRAQAQQAIVAAVACLKEPQTQPETTSSAPSVNSEVLDLAANQAHELEDIAKRIGEPSSWRQALNCCTSWPKSYHAL